MTDDVDERKRKTLRRFAALGAAAPLVGTASASDDSDPASVERDDNETRDAIRGYVVTTPGAHFSKLRDDLRLGTGETQYHLRKLESNGEIESIKDGEFRRFYSTDRFDDVDKRALGYLRRETPRGMILNLLRDPELNGSEIAAALDVSHPTVSSAAGSLEEAGILDRSDGYTLREPERLITLVVRYAESFGPDAAAFADDSVDYLRYDPN